MIIKILINVSRFQGLKAKTQDIQHQSHPNLLITSYKQKQLPKEKYIDFEPVNPIHNPKDET